MPQSHHAPAPESTSDAGAWFCSGSTTFGTILSEKAGNERSLQNARPLLALSNTIYQTPEPHFRRRRLILFGIWQPTPHIVQNFFFIIYYLQIWDSIPKSQTQLQAPALDFLRHPELLWKGEKTGTPLQTPPPDFIRDPALFGTLTKSEKAGNERSLQNAHPLLKNKFQVLYVDLPFPKTMYGTKVSYLKVNLSRLNGW